MRTGTTLACHKQVHALADISRGSKAKEIVVFQFRPCKLSKSEAAAEASLLKNIPLVGAIASGVCVGRVARDKPKGMVSFC